MTISTKHFTTLLTIVISIFFLAACGGGGSSSTGSTPTSNLVAHNITIADPAAYYSHSCSEPSIQFVIPVNINDDSQSDFIVHYWCDADPYGSVVEGPTPDALVAQVSQPDGSYAVANEEVFGAAHYGLGGTARKVKRGDINGDGQDDFVFAMSWEDGRYNVDPTVCEAKPAVLMSTGPGTYEVARLGEPAWGHGTGIVNNADGTVEVFFAGFSGDNFQAFKYVDDGFLDVSDTYPSDAANWASGAKSIDVNGVTEYIVGTWAEGDINGLKLYKRSSNSWVDLDEYGIPIAFETGWINWSEAEDTVKVFGVGGELSFGTTVESFDILKGGLSGYDDDLIVGKLNAQVLVGGGTIVEGVTYHENQTNPVNTFQFFQFSDEGLTLIDSPIVNEETNYTGNFFDTKDITGDGYPDLVSYAFTTPWDGIRVEEAGKPIIYSNDGNGNLVLTDINELPGFEGSQGSQSLMHDVDGDDIVDLILYGLKATTDSKGIVIHLLKDHIE